MIGIYLIRNLKNNKVYIGQSIDIERRFREHKNRTFYTKYQTPLYKALKKYGLENFSFEILENCSVEELDAKEKDNIEKYKSFNKEFGYNFTIGGRGYSGNFTEEHKQKISESKKGIKFPVSDETRQKRSKALKGKTKPESFKIKISLIHKGKKLSEETKEKIRKKLLGFKHTEATKEKLRNKPPQKHTEATKQIISKKVSKKVYMFDLENNYIKTFENARKAQEETGINYTNISACCNGRRKNAGGYIWSFKEATK